MVSLDESRWIDANKIVPLLRELVLRCDGIRAASQYSGISEMTIHRILHHRVVQVQKRTARLIILALYERRKDDRRNGQSKAFRHAIAMQARMEERMLSLAGY